MDVEITLSVDASVISTTPNDEKFNVDLLIDYLSTASLDGAYLTDGSKTPVAGGSVSAESGTTYAIVPEPGALTLLAMSGLALMRRKSTRSSRATR
ncbi:MAG: hypothetical protein IIC09_04110 [Proteobacteria bacterium]|nr:hypothetical protein [Pseudomonadota bacterium]